MGQPLNVAVTTDYSAINFSPIVDSITFINAAAVSATGTFAGAQFTGGQISMSALITGSAGANRILINMGPIPSLFTNFVFQNWSANDRVQINGNADAQVISGTAVAERIFAAGGADTILGSEGDDYLDGGGGADTFKIATSDDSSGDTLAGGADIDTLLLSSAEMYDFTYVTFSSVEKLVFSPSSGTSALAFFWDNQISVPGGINTVQTTTTLATTLEVKGSLIDLSGLTFVNWSDAKDKIYISLTGATASGVGTAFADYFSTLEGSDNVDAGFGDDTIESSQGLDRFFGEDGDDLFHIGEYFDIEAGEVYDGGAGAADTLEIGDNIAPFFDFSQATVRDIELLTFAPTSLFSNKVALSSSQIGAAADDIKTIVGTGLQETLRVTGSSMNLASTVFLSWSSTNDRVELNGTAGNDNLAGSKVKDFYSGGAGNDTFRFTSLQVAGTGGGRDVIMDFVKGSDRIHLAGIDADGNAANGDTAFTFITTGFTGVAGQLRSSINANGKTIVAGDINGDKSVDFQIELDTGLVLAAGDFVP